jgi:hypothetical protein
MTSLILGSINDAPSPDQIIYRWMRRLLWTKNCDSCGRTWLSRPSCVRKQRGKSWKASALQAIHTDTDYDLTVTKAVCYNMLTTTYIFYGGWSEVYDTKKRWKVPRRLQRILMVVYTTQSCCGFRLLPSSVIKETLENTMLRKPDVSILRWRGKTLCWVSHKDLIPVTGSCVL